MSFQRMLKEKYIFMLTIDNIYMNLEGMIHKIYPEELQLNKANSTDTKARFLDLNLSISGPCHVKMCLWAYVDREGPEQFAHPPSLIKAFPVHCATEPLDTILQWTAKLMPGCDCVCAG